MSDPDTDGKSRHADNWTGPVVGGAILILIGAALFAGEMGIHFPGSTWALLLLVPAASLAIAAYRNAQSGGSTARTGAHIIGAIIFAAVSLALFFGLDTGMLWPILLVLLGVGVIVRGYLRRSGQ